MYLSIKIVFSFLHQSALGVLQSPIYLAEQPRTDAAGIECIVVTRRVDAVAQETAARGYTPRFICESAGTQAEDAAAMMRCYQEYMKQFSAIDKKV